MRKLLALAVLLLVGCANVPPTGRFVADCSYEQQDSQTVLLRCRQIITATPSPTRTPTPVPVYHPGYPAPLIVHNNHSFRVRIRDCSNMSEDNPVLCPQAKAPAIDQTTGQVYQTYLFVEQGQFWRAWRHLFPADNASVVWVALHTDSDPVRWWAAVCLNSETLLDAYILDGYPPDTDLAEVFVLRRDSGTLPEPKSCYYPQG